MKTLRITQSRVAASCNRVEIALEGDGQVRQTVTSDFRFEMTAQDEEDIRWYLEEYLQFPFDPAPRIAARVERRIAEVGKELFESAFGKSQQGQRLWAKVYESLSDLRIEIASSVSESSMIPWELLRDPLTDTSLALRAKAFVRSHSEAVEAPMRLDEPQGPVRVLLVICRPNLDRDVPFRSVASRLLKALTDQARQQFELHVLRPPTYEQLARRLREAKASGRPYHVMHFDGHGLYTDQDRLSPLMLSGKRSGLHGYLAFENAAAAENMQLVDGAALGRLLRETDCPVLVLNACRSAHSEPLPQPQNVGQRAQEVGDGTDVVHAQIRAYGSLAQEIIDTGMSGVVAMRHNVYVVTAAQFVADLYTSLAQGSSLGESCSTRPRSPCCLCFNPPPVRAPGESRPAYASAREAYEFQSAPGASTGGIIAVRPHHLQDDRVSIRPRCEHRGNRSRPARRRRTRSCFNPPPVRAPGESRDWRAAGGGT